MTTIQDLIKFYEGIPEDQRCESMLRNERGQCCAIGHLNLRLNGGSDGRDVRALKCDAAHELLRNLGIHSMIMIEVNDGELHIAGTHTARERVLTFLRGLQ